MTIERGSMKSIKKFLAVILSMTLMLTLGTATFGAQKTLPSGKDTGSINVTNLKPGDTVTAYQFVKANYNEYGFTGYSAINNYVKDPVAPTAQEVIDMASNAATMTVAAEKKVATGDTEVTLNGLPVGYYLVMVTSGSLIEKLNATKKLVNRKICCNNFCKRRYFM